jgi:2-oxo-3-hexenedioate decarboxylase
MKLDNNTISGIAEHLKNAEIRARSVPAITDDHPEMDLDDAYAIQETIRQSNESRGQKTVGLKCGLTSHGPMKQMGVTTPAFGFVSDYMAVAEGSAIKTSELIDPKVEAQICVVTKSPLRGPGCHIGAVMAAIDFVMPGIEVIDSRYNDFQFDLKSMIADNIAASRFVVGGRARNVEELDLRTVGVVMEKNGEIAAMAAGAAVMGHPAASIAALANHLGKLGQEIPAGTFIMTGGVTGGISVQAGDSITVRFQDLGTVALRFT